MQSRLPVRVRYTAAQGLRRPPSGEKPRLRLTDEVYRGVLVESAQILAWPRCFHQHQQFNRSFQGDRSHGAEGLY